MFTIQGDYFSIMFNTRSSVTGYTPILSLSSFRSLPPPLPSSLSLPLSPFPSLPSPLSLPLSPFPSLPSPLSLPLSLFSPPLPLSPSLQLYLAPPLPPLPPLPLSPALPSSPSSPLSLFPSLPLPVSPSLSQCALQLTFSISYHKTVHSFVSFVYLVYITVLRKLSGCLSLFLFLPVVFEIFGSILSLLRFVSLSIITDRVKYFL